MARTKAGLPSGSRISDYISLGVIARWCPRPSVERALAETGKASQRVRELPAHVVVLLLDPDEAPAAELAALYHERWEIESAFDELKTDLRGARIVLRSKTPELVRQEFYGLLLAHFAIRGLMLEAALRGDRDPDELSFLHAVRVVRRKIVATIAFSPSEGKSAT